MYLCRWFFGVLDDLIVGLCQVFGFVSQVQNECFFWFKLGTCFGERVSATIR